MRSIISVLLLALAVSACGRVFNPIQLMKRMAPEVVLLNPPTTNQSGATGFEVRTESGHLYTITNAHVCRMPGAENGFLNAHRADEERAYSIRILEISNDTDLCILEAIPQARGLRLAPNVNPENEFHIYGHPLLKRLTLASGWIMGREPIWLLAERSVEACVGARFKVESIQTFIGSFQVCVESIDSIHTTAIIYPGNSGSPAVDDNGNVLGVVFAGDSRTNEGYLIPLDVLKAFLANY